MLAAEGLWVEPASAAGLAGLMVQTESGELDLKGSQVAIICTGHGLKDPEIITDHMPQPKLIPATDQALADALEL
jgi:threonine synthase